MNDDEITPAEVITEGFRWLPVVFIGTFIAVAGILLLTLVLWLAGVWFQNQAPNQQYSRTVHSQGYQTAQLQQMEVHYGNIAGAGGVQATRATLSATDPYQYSLRAQELSELRGFCSEAVQVTPFSTEATQMLAIASRNCIAGVPVANPPLAPVVPHRRNS